MCNKKKQEKHLNLATINYKNLLLSESDINKNLCDIKKFDLFVFIASHRTETCFSVLYFSSESVFYMYMYLLVY